ncbi:MAG: ScyD/ScyE family protein, partial [Terracidiphilus sp.]
MRKFQMGILLTATALTASILSTPAYPQPSSNVHVLVQDGLEGPRGLRFGPDGNLYVAEAGTGGSNSTQGQCTQVVPPVGPYTGGKTGRISKVDMSGNVTTVATGFPSSADSMGDTSGVADLTFLNGTLYALIGGGGCSHGVPDLPNGIAAVNVHNGKWNYIANLSAFIQSHPVKYPNADDFEPDGTFYSMTSFRGQLYAVEPNHGQVLKVGPNGSIASVLDVSANEGHIVPTAITFHNGNFYLGNLYLFPINPTNSRILTLSFVDTSFLSAPGLMDQGGPGSLHIISSKAGFTTVVSTAFGPDGKLYALELSDAAGDPTPGAGKVVRVNFDGTIEDVATGLAVPTAMTFGPRGRLYVSNLGAAPAGAGQIVWIDIN